MYEVIATNVNGVKRAQARSNAVGHVEILLLRPHAPHQIHDRTAPLVVQVGEVRIEAKGVGVDVQVRRLVLPLAEGVSVLPAVAEVLEALVVGRRTAW